MIKTSKIYPDLNLTSPSQQEVNPQNYRLSKISEAEVYFLDAISKNEKLAKNIDVQPLFQKFLTLN